MEDKKQITWLNCSKFIAILAVMVDHTNGVLYRNQDIAYASFFSVELFIILCGMTSYLSNSRRAETWWQSFSRGCRKLVVAYCIAVMVYMLVGTHGFDFCQYLTHLVNFDAASPHYFVLLYIQLMVVNRFLYNLLQKCPCSFRGYFYEALIMGMIIIFASWTIGNTNILGVFGGGGTLFGGTYLILFYFGMLVMRHGWLGNTSAVKSAAAFIGAGIIWFLLWRFVCANGLALENYAPFGSGFNPPGITFMSFALCMLFITFGFFTLLERVKFLRAVSDFIAWCGTHTMYIFLYHALILNYLLKKYMGGLPDQNIWVARIVYFSLMAAGSILLEIAISKAQKFVMQVMGVRNDA